MTSLVKQQTTDRRAGGQSSRRRFAIIRITPLVLLLLPLEHDELRNKYSTEQAPFENTQHGWHTPAAWWQQWRVVSDCCFVHLPDANAFQLPAARIDVPTDGENTEQLRSKRNTRSYSGAIVRRQRASPNGIIAASGALICAICRTLQYRELGTRTRSTAQPRPFRQTTDGIWTASDGSPQWTDCSWRYCRYMSLLTPSL